MEKLLENLMNTNVRKNEGYIFVMKEEIFVPIIKVVLSITKRSFYSLPLLDEMVLRLISEGVQEIDELSSVLGIKRKLLEVTLADLSVKDMIYCTTNRCSLLAKGKVALRELRTIQRCKDSIKNIYLDPINQKIIVDYNNYQFQDKVYNHDKKLDVDFEVNDTEVFKENIDSVNKVFLDEMNIYNDKTKSDIDELLSIDYIEKVYVKFVRIPIYIYVSASGYDIDILAVNKRNDMLLTQFKDEIIGQIRKKKVLKNTFVKYRPRKSFEKIDLKESTCLNELLFKYKRNCSDRNELKQIIEKEAFTNRKLYDDEFEVLLKYFADNSEKIDIDVDHLDDWVKNEFSVRVLSIISSKKLGLINYTQCYDLKKSISVLQRTLPGCARDKVCQKKGEYFFSIVFDEKYIIIGVPQDIAIIDSWTHIHKVEYYFQAKNLGKIQKIQKY